MALDLNRLPRTITMEMRDGVPVVRMIDQRLLPYEEAYIETSDWRSVVDAIKTLALRGAPAIGVAGAAAVMLRAWEFLAAGAGSGTGGKAPVLVGGSGAEETEAFAGLMCQRSGGDGCSAGALEEDADAAQRAMAAHRTFLLDEDGFDPELFALGMGLAADQIAAARPTAVNLAWGVDRAMRTVTDLQAAGEGQVAIAEALFSLCQEMITEDEAVNRAIGRNGAELLPPDCSVLTHCNAGSLATAFYGTALGIVYSAADQGKVRRVYADETRPVGQGARLTVWELSRAGVPITLICDDMAASVMAAGKVDAVVVGADRIAANGDVANKIGTLGVAVLARHFGIPFYVAAPRSTIDVGTPTGRDIVIEQRDSAEVLPQPVAGVEVENPAFDVTPAKLVTAIITETGVFRPEQLKDALS